MSGYYTCKGKGGTYEVLNQRHGDDTHFGATGAGTSRGGPGLTVYRDTLSRQVFYRTCEDFSKRMRLVLDCPDCEARQQAQDKLELDRALLDALPDEF